MAGINGWDGGEGGEGGDCIAQVEVSIWWAGANTPATPAKSAGVLTLTTTHVRFTGEGPTSAWDRLLWSVVKLGHEPPTTLTIQFKLWEAVYIQCLSEEDTEELRTAFHTALAPVTAVADLVPFAVGRADGNGDASASPVPNFVGQASRFLETHDGWRLSTANAKYKVSATYPRGLLVPSHVPDDVLIAAAKHRRYGRLPALTYAHGPSGARLVRCAQPLAGPRSRADEFLVASLCIPGHATSWEEFAAMAVETGLADPGSAPSSLFSQLSQSVLASVAAQLPSPQASQASQAQDDPKADYYICDLRAPRGIMRAQSHGGGTETPQHYAGAACVTLNGEFSVRGLRDSANTLAELVQDSKASMGSWLQRLDSCGWLRTVAWALDTARIVAARIAKGKSCVVHGDDGWDMTAVVVSLAQVILDPSCRTRHGLAVLIEKDWLAFGHRFSDRCGHLGAAHDAPVFVLFLDCLRCLGHRYPRAFEFSAHFLDALARTAYASPYGTFLCNSEAERRSLKVSVRTQSAWPWLVQDPALANPFFESTSQSLLEPVRAQILSVWLGLFGGQSVRSPPSVQLSLPPDAVLRKLQHQAMAEIAARAADNARAENDSERDEPPRVQPSVSSSGPPTPTPTATGTAAPVRRVVPAQNIFSDGGQSFTKAKSTGSPRRAAPQATPEPGPPAAHPQHAPTAACEQCHSPLCICNT